MLAWILLGLMGCPRQTSTPAAPDSAIRRTQNDMAVVEAHLLSAAASDDPIVRAHALVGLAKASKVGDEQFLLRGVLDPSPWVQRAIARALPQQAAVHFINRTERDSVARALALAGLSADERKELDLQIGRTTTGDLVGGALLGDADATEALLALAKEGAFPPEEDLFWAMGQTGSVVLGEALAEGIPFAEDLIRVQMALVSQYLAPKQASSALSAALSDATIDQRLEAVEGLVVYDTPAGRQFLLRASKGPAGTVRDHAKLAMVALVGEPLARAEEALVSPDRDVRAWAATCLMHAGAERPLHRNLVLALINARQDEAPAVRVAAVRALEVMSATDAIVIPGGFWARKPDSVSTVMAASLWLSAGKE